MPVIEGYRFAVSLEDRGLSRGLEAIKSEARTLKAVMRANFTELDKGTGSMAAFNDRIKKATDVIGTYKIGIEKAQGKIKELENEQKRLAQHVTKANGEAMSGNDIKINKQIRTIINYRRQQKLLQAQIDNDRMAVARARTGIDQFRDATENITKANNTYVRSLAAGGRFYQADRARVSGLKTQREALAAQMRAEGQVTGQLKAKVTELSSAESKEMHSLRSLSSESSDAKSKYLWLNKTLGANAEVTKQAKQHYDELNSKLNATRGTLQGLGEKIGKANSQYVNQADKLRVLAGRYQEVNKQAGRFSTSRFSSGIRSIGHFNKAVSNSFSNTRKWASGLRDGFYKVSAAAGVMGAGLIKAVNDAAKVQRQYIEVRNLLNTSGESAAEAVHHMNTMQRDGIKYSEKYGFSQQEIGKQYEELARRGYSGRAAIGSMNAMMQASRASGDDLGDVVNVVAQAVDAFGLRVNNATKMMRNSTRVANAMASGADRTAAGFQDMGVAMGYVSGSFKTVGGTVEQASAAIGELSNRGLEGTRAGTGLRKVINSLIKPTASATKALQSAGLSIQDFKTKSGKLKPIDQIFQTINRHTKGWAKTRKGAFFTKIFGTTGQQAAQFLAQSAGGLKNNDDELTKLINHIKKDEKTNYIGHLAKKNMQSGQMQIERLKRTAQAFELTVGAKLLPAVNKVGNKIAKWAVSKEGNRSINAFAGAVGKVAMTVASHGGDIIAFGQGLYHGLHDSYEVTKAMLSPLQKMLVFFHIERNQTHSFARTLGKIVGLFGGITIGVKVLRTVFGGVLALGKDGLGIAQGIKQHVFHTSSETQTLNKQLATEVGLAKEVLAQQKAITSEIAKQNGLEKTSGGGSKNGSGGSDIADDLSNIDLGGDSKGNTRMSRRLNASAEKEADIAAESFHRRFNAKLLHPRSADISWKQVFKPGEKAAMASGTESGIGYTTRMGRRMLNSRGNVKFSALFKYGERAASFSGDKSGLGFVRRAAMHIGNGRSMFAKGIQLLTGASVGTVAEAGAKGGSGFVSKATGLISKGADAFGIAVSVATAGINLVKGLREHNPTKKMRDYGKTGGAVVGGGLGAALGSIVPGVGTAAGAALGAALGSAIGDKLPEMVRWGRKTVHAFAKGFQGGMHWFNQILNGDWKGVQKGFNQFWGGIGDWFDKEFNVNQKRTRSTVHRKKKTTISQRIIRTGVRIKKRDVANVRAMSRALGTYAHQLRRVKGELKKYDPSKQLNKVNSFLKRHTKEWRDTAKPIRQIGDAFKYLAKFAGSVAKKDAFAAFNKDLPRLDSTLKKHGKSITNGIKKITAALKGKGKGNTLENQFKKLDRSLDKISKKFKGLNRYLNKTASDFKTLDKVFKDFTKRKNPLANMAAGLDKLKRALSKDTSKISSNLQKIVKVFRGDKKNGNFASELNKVNKPLSNVSKSFKTMAKSIQPVRKGLKDISTAIKELAGGGKTLMQKFSHGFNELKKTLSADSKSIATNLGKINKALGVSTKRGKGSKGLIAAVGSSVKSMRKFNKQLKAVSKPIKSIAQSLKSTAKQFKYLASKRQGIPSVTSALAKLSKATKKYPFGRRIAKEARKAAKGFKGKGNFASAFRRTTSRTLKYQRSFVSKFKKRWQDLFSDIRKEDNSWEKKMHSMQNSFSSRWEKGWQSMGTSTEKIFEHYWANMRKEAGRGINRVLSILNSGITKINSVVREFGGSGSSKHVGYVHYATGTGVFNNARRPITKPTIAMLNDGNDSPETGNQEAIWNKRTGNVSLVEGRNVPFLLTPDHEVFNASETKALGLTHYASGTGSLKALYELTKKFYKNPTGTLGAMFAGLGSAIKGTMRSISQNMKGTAEGTTQTWWTTLWEMVHKKIDGGSVATGLLKAVENLGRGKRYVWGAWGPSAYDCSGLVSRAIQKYYHKSWGRMSVAGLWHHAHRISRSQARPGDPIFWLPNHHVGIFMGGDKYWSAYAPGAHPAVGVHSIKGSVPGVRPTFGRFYGISGESHGNSHVKANTPLERLIRGQVGKGFWRTISKIAEKYGDSLGAFGLTGSLRRRARTLYRALHRLDPRATRNGIAAILGNWVFESGGLNPGAINGGSGASGLGQWLGSRLSGLKAYARRHHTSWRNPALQLRYAYSGDGTNTSAFRRILRGHGSVASLAAQFSNLWERGGHTAQHVAGAEEIVRALGFANGGITNKPAIFGEAGPEMAIPLSPDKQPRAIDLLAKTVAIMKANGAGGSTSAQELAQQQALSDKLDTMIELLLKLADKSTTFNADIKMDGRKVAQATAKYNSQMNSNNIRNERQHISYGY